MSDARAEALRQFDEIAMDVALAVLRLRNAAGYDNAIATLECLAATLREEQAAKRAVIH